MSTACPTDRPPLFPPASMDPGATAAGAEPAFERAAVLPARPARVAPRQEGARFLVDLLLGATLMAMVHLFLVQISVVRGHSMEPSLWDGDRLVVDRVTYQLANVGRNDIVVMRCPANPEVDFVKRVVGLPGDRVEMHGGRLLVNGMELNADYQPIADAADMADLLVPEGHYFVLGDNRPVSCDSREFGLVAQELLRGRVRMRFWPPERFALF